MLFAHMGWGHIPHALHMTFTSCRHDPSSAAEGRHPAVTAYITRTLQERYNMEDTQKVVKSIFCDFGSDYSVCLFFMPFADSSDSCLGASWTCWWSSIKRKKEKVVATGIGYQLLGWPKLFGEGGWNHHMIKWNLRIYKHSVLYESVQKSTGKKCCIWLGTVKESHH